MHLHSLNTHCDYAFKRCVYVFKRCVYINAHCEQRFITIRKNFSINKEDFYKLYRESFLLTSNKPPMYSERLDESISVDTRLISNPGSA